MSLALSATFVSPRVHAAASPYVGRRVNSRSSTWVNAQIRIMFLYRLLSWELLWENTAITTPRGQILCEDALRNDRNTIHKVIILSLAITAIHLLHVTCQPWVDFIGFSFFFSWSTNLTLICLLYIFIYLFFRFFDIWLTATFFPLACSGFFKMILIGPGGEL